MRLFWSTIKYRLKSLCTRAHGIVFFALALAVAVCPFIGLIIPDAPVPIGWIDEDNTAFSALLLKNVQALDVVWVTRADENTLMANLQTGRLEGVFVIKKGFEDAIRQGRFEDTLVLLRSPYSTAAGVISESVGSEAIRLWLTCYSANEADRLGGKALYQAVFDDAAAGTDTPILSIIRQNAVGQTGEVTPLLDAAYTSLYLLAGLAGFFMLSGIAVSAKNPDFAARLRSRAFSAEGFRLSICVADTAYILPCAAVPLAAFGLAGAGGLIGPLLILFTLYVLSFGGIAALTAQIKNQTVLMLTVSVITIANVMFGSLLIPLPSSGWFGVLTCLLPARWLSFIQTLDPLVCIAGLAACAVVYNGLPFLNKRKQS